MLDNRSSEIMVISYPAIRDGGDKCLRLPDEHVKAVIPFDVLWRAFKTFDTEPGAASFVCALAGVSPAFNRICNTRQIRNGWQRQLMSCMPESCFGQQELVISPVEHSRFFVDPEPLAAFAANHVDSNLVAPSRTCHMVVVCGKDQCERQVIEQTLNISTRSIDRI
jgi:hypothetical protein